MAVIKASKGGKSLGRAINYAAKDGIVSGKDCPDDPALAREQMQATKEAFEKEGGRLYKPYVQSFDKGEVTPEQAHQIGKEFAEKAFPGHEVIVGTHTESKSGVIHNHFVVNSVSFEDGHKIHTDNKDLERFKSISDDLCREHGLSVIDRTQARERGTVVAWDMKKYQMIAKSLEGKGQSYVVDIAKGVDQSLEQSKGKGMGAFQEALKERGIQMEMRGNKHITFTDQEGNKVRGATLAKTFSDERYDREAIRSITLTQKTPEREISQSQTHSKVELPKMQSVTEIKTQTQQLDAKVHTVPEAGKEGHSIGGGGAGGGSQQHHQQPQHEAPARGGGGAASLGDGKPTLEDLLAKGIPMEKAQEILDEMDGFKIQLGGINTDSVFDMFGKGGQSRSASGGGSGGGGGGSRETPEEYQKRMHETFKKMDTDKITELKTNLAQAEKNNKLFEKDGRPALIEAGRKRYQEIKQELDRAVKKFDERYNPRKPEQSQNIEKTQTQERTKTQERSRQPERKAPEKSKSISFER